MGVLSSLYTSISGIEANGTALGVISDNISNSNTIGYKTSRAEFSDIIAKSLKGELGGNQIGRGVTLSGVKQIFTQGNMKQTDRPTDLAITGDGFFALDGPNGRVYTRNGAFNFDKEGVLINSDGYKVLGFQADEKGDISTKLGVIQLDRNILDAKSTSEVKMFMNLDVRASAAQEDFNIEDPEATSSYSTGVTVYDTAGNAHTVTAYFTKTGDNTWAWNAVVKGDEIEGAEPGTAVVGASGTLTFDNNGRLLAQEINENSFSFTNGAKPNQAIEFNFGDDITNGGTGVKGSTQYGSQSDIYQTMQDGYEVGTVGGLSFNDDGVLSAFYTNGITQNLAQVSIARFENKEGLFKLGNNVLKESRSSGQPNIGRPGSGGRGKVFSKTVEASTTDIAFEFISLIQMQRAFQASARTMGTADELMQEILNMRRG